MAKMILRADDGQETELDLRVLRLGPNDRLLVQFDTAYLAPSTLERINETVAEWAGIDKQRVLVVNGSDTEISILRPGA